MSVFIDLQHRIFAESGQIEIKSVAEDTPLTQPNNMNREVDLDLFGTIHIEGVLVGKVLGDDHVESDTGLTTIDLLVSNKDDVVDEVFASTAPKVMPVHGEVDYVAGLTPQNGVVSIEPPLELQAVA